MAYHFKRAAALFGVSIISLAAVAPALADEAADIASDAAADAEAEAAGGSGNVILVTASRREERIQDVPTAVSVLGQDLFKLNGVGRSANEVLNYIPNALSVGM